MKHLLRTSAGLLPATMLAVTAMTILFAPAALLPRIVAAGGRALRRAREDQAGVSEIAVIALVTGLAALVVVAYMTIVRGKVEDEANRLPTSGG